MITKRAMIEEQHLFGTIDKHQAIASPGKMADKSVDTKLVLSWQRSMAADIPTTRSTAPLVQVEQENTALALDLVLPRCAAELQHIAEQCSMVVAITNVAGTLLWTASGRHMRSAAESVHFTTGGKWDERSVGTNGIGLALTTHETSCVFSNQHYMESVHNWVCYATPIIDPYSKQVIGIMDLSSTWDKHSPMGLLAVERCAAMVQNALMAQQKQHLYIRAFSAPQVLFNKRNANLPPRQIEILVILALCPQGLNLDQLHQALYGERKISVSTLKAELSQLRQTLGSMLGSRPYRLTATVEADFLQAEKALDAGHLQSALEICTGAFLAKTESPFLRAWRDYLESRISDAIYNSDESSTLFKHLSRSPDAVDVAERLTELLPDANPAHHQLIRYKGIH